MSTLREEALKMHKENKGKLGVYSKVQVRSAKDLSLAYSPGVAEPCLEIHKIDRKSIFIPPHFKFNLNFNKNIRN